MDVFPVTVRGPIPTGSVRFARMFTHGGKLYIAEGIQRGRKVTKVTQYDIPDQEPVRTGNRTTWGPWSYSSCGCGNQWGSHTVEELVSLAESVPTA